MLISFILLFLILSALFSGTEIAFISASKLRVELERQKGSTRGAILARFYDKPAEFLGTMLVGNNIALVFFTLLMDELLAPFFSNVLNISVGGPLSLLISTLITTIIILIFGEFLPKTLFRLYADEILHFLAYPLRAIKFLLFIPSWLMNKLSNWVLRVILKTPVERVDTVITRMDLENFIKKTSRLDSEEEIDTDYFEKALHLSNVKAKDCMIPRTEIEGLDIQSTVDDLKALFAETRHSRLIVYKDDMDDVLGYVHHQQMLRNPKSIRHMIIDIPFVPETIRVRELLNKFIKEGKNIACVVDEFGGTAGVITLEDILEEIFGEIEDEYDQEDYLEQKISDNEYIFSGRLEIDYLNEKYPELNFPSGEYSTLSGYLVTTTEMIPAQGVELEMNGFMFILEMVSDTKIETIRILKVEKDNEEVD